MAKRKKNNSVAQKGGAPEKPAVNAPAAHIAVQVFASGMAVMALELAASRLYVPYFGSTVFVWAGLIGALLFFLAVGYHFGGRLSRAGAGPERLFQLMLAASVYAGVSPYAAKPVMAYMAARAGIGGDMLAGVLLTSVVALAVPLVLFGTALPLSTGILSRDGRDAGSVAGFLSMVSTAGSILGVFLPVLITLPTIGTRLTFLVFAAAPALVASAGLARARWFLPLLVFVPCGVLAHSTPIKGPIAGFKIISEHETAYNYVQMDKKGDTVMMTVDQGWYVYSVYEPGKLRSDTYRDYFPLAGVLSPEPGFPRKVCVLGAAGGTDARILKHAFPGARVTGVEIDPGLVALGNKYMRLKSHTDRIVVADGRAFLRESDEKFDLIIVDVYNQSYIPFHMATVEFFRLLRDRLSPRGVVAFNVAWRSPEDWDLARRCADTLNAVFPSVYVRPLLGKSNTLLFASVRKTDFNTLSSNAASHKNGYVRELLAEYPVPMEPYKSAGKPFTDDLAPVEYLTDVTTKKLFSLVRGIE